MPSQVGIMIAKRLPTTLGPADHYDVHVSGDILEAFRGKVREVKIHGDDVLLSPGMRVHSFDADAVDIHADTHTSAIKSIGHVTFHIGMLPSDINNYLAFSDTTGTSAASVSMSTGDMTYSDSVSLLGLTTPFSVTGTLSPRPGRPSQMDFRPSRGSISVVHLPIQLINLAVSHHNPVVDLSQMKYPVAITGARVDHGVLLVDGAVDLSALVGTSPTAQERTSAR